jgi:hypothetical protein
LLVDPQTGNPKDMVTLDELLEATNGVNPFEIPAGTPYDDPRIAPLTTALFCVGIELQIGLPPGVLPKNLPPIASLGNSANNVEFNLFCSKLTVIQNQPPSGWGSAGSWNVWSQPSGTPWYFSTKVNLVMADLDKELDTPYVSSHPDEKAALLRQLENLSATAFSLQQLMFDLSNAALQTLPQLAGIPDDSNAAIVLYKSFINIYSDLAKERGWPLLAVATTVQTPDPSQLQLTAFERQVSLLKDNNGVPIKNPTAEQKKVTTLDHLCAANNHALPGTSSFSWNWVLPTEVDQQSGVVSINRNSMADFFLPQILPIARNNCILCEPRAEADPLSPAGTVGIRITSGQMPTKIETTASGDKVMHIEYTDQGINIFDQILTDTYAMSVSQAGGLQIGHTGSVSQDDSEDPDASGSVNFWTGINDVLASLKEQFHAVEWMKLDAIPFDTLHAFIFPGSKTFTYKAVNFSDYQDLVCAITYVDPSQARRKLRDVQALTGTFHPEASPGLVLTSSSQMMQNYAHGQLMSPTEKFQALQTASGYALLFAIDTSGVFRVIEEKSGKANIGWVATDLSTSLIAAEFGGASNVKVDTFDVG